MQKFKVNKDSVTLRFTPNKGLFKSAKDDSRHIVSQGTEVNGYDIYVIVKQAKPPFRKFPVGKHVIKIDDGIYIPFENVSPTEVGSGADGRASIIDPLFRKKPIRDEFGRNPIRDEFGKRKPIRDEFGRVVNMKPIRDEFGKKSGAEGKKSIIDPLFKLGGQKIATNSDNNANKRTIIDPLFKPTARNNQNSRILFNDNTPMGTKKNEIAQNQEKLKDKLGNGGDVTISYSVMRGFDGKVSKAEGLDLSNVDLLDDSIDILQPYKSPIDNSVGYRSLEAAVFEPHYSGATGDNTDPNAKPYEIPASDFEAMIYKASGSKKSFKDWLNSGGLEIIASLSAVAAAILNGKNATYTEDSNGNVKVIDDASDKKSDNTIFGMHPVTAGIIGLSILAVGAYFVFRSGKAKAGKPATPATHPMI